MSRNKNARKQYQPQIRQARVATDAQAVMQSTNDHPPVWQLKLLDFENDAWGWKKLDAQTFPTILNKLKNFESMTWKEIQADKSSDYFHFVSMQQLNSQAQKRLTELKLDDLDGLFRLRLSGLQRIWGIREGYIFKIIWWDPQHTVCPSQKKHT